MRVQAAAARLDNPPQEVPIRAAAGSSSTAAAWPPWGGQADPGCGSGYPAAPAQACTDQPFLREAILARRGWLAPQARRTGRTVASSAAARRLSLVRGACRGRGEAGRRRVRPNPAVAILYQPGPAFVRL